MVAGAREAFCNGTHWDRALGACRLVGVGPATSCDFEADACGWQTADSVADDSEWRRRNGAVSADLQHTGPLHDHTVGRPLEGWYMVTHVANPQVESTVRLVSPLYEAALSRRACFRLWYHMYGQQVGRVRVYLKPVDVADFADIGREQILFEREGNQANEWHEELISLNEESQEFQIVVEATRSTLRRSTIQRAALLRTPVSRLSNIAIDDVALLQDADCQTEQDALAAATTPAEEEAGGVADVESCAGRCATTGGEEDGAAAAQSQTVSWLPGNVLSCECSMGCVEARTCCPDFMDVCVDKGGCGGVLSVVRREKLSNCIASLSVVFR